MSQHTDTPRTDAMLALCSDVPRDMTNFARQLERELTAALERIKSLETVVRAQELKLTEAKNLVCDTFLNGTAGKYVGDLMKDRDEWKQRAEAAEQDGKRLDWLVLIRTTDRAGGNYLEFSWLDKSIRTAIDQAMKGETE